MRTLQERDNSIASFLCAMQWILKYLEEAVRVERLVARKTLPDDVRKTLQELAAHYRRKAEERAKNIGIPPPAKPE
jgi:hypothetical protein